MARLTRRQLEDRLGRLEIRFGQLLTVVSIQRQMLQRIALEIGYTVATTVGSSSRVAASGSSASIWTSPAKNFPVPALDTLMDNIHASGTSYVG